MYTYILGKYYSQKKNRDVEVFWGPFSPEEAETVALKHLLPVQGTYQLVTSRYATRAQARQEVMSSTITGGQATLEDALTRYRSRPEAVEGGV